MVSQELSAALLEEVEAVLRRCPVIWDNLYANDYDCRRVFLGPYMGRAPGLMSKLHGLLLNPNCELQANFIPIHTLGTWFQSELGSCAHPDQAGTPVPRQLCACPSLPSPAAFLHRTRAGQADELQFLRNGGGGSPRGQPRCSGWKLQPPGSLGTGAA